MSRALLAATHQTTVTAVAARKAKQTRQTRTMVSTDQRRARCGSRIGLSGVTSALMTGTSFSLTLPLPPATLQLSSHRRPCRVLWEACFMLRLDAEVRRLPAEVVSLLDGLHRELRDGDVEEHVGAAV